MAGHGRHVLARGQRSEARGQVLTCRAKLAGGVGCCCTLRGLVKKAQALVELTNARGDVGRGPTCLAHGRLSVRKLVASVRPAQDVSGLGCGAVRAAECLVGSRHVGCESPDTLRFRSPHSGLLGRGKVRHLVARQLLCKRLTSTLVESQPLCLLQ